MRQPYHHRSLAVTMYIAANVCLGGLEMAEVRRSLERLATEVVPHFQRAALSS